MRRLLQVIRAMTRASIKVSVQKALTKARASLMARERDSTKVYNLLTCGPFACMRTS